MKSWSQRELALAVLVVFAALFVACAIFVPNFATFINMKGLGLAISMSGMVACGMLFCLASGDFDLSVASVIACAGVTTAVVINLSESLWLGIAAGLLLGIATLIATVMHVPADAQGTLPDALNFMKVFSKGLFTFLVILVGYNAAQAFGGTGVNGAIIAALFLLGYNPAATTGYYAGFHDFFGLPIDPRGNIIGVLIAAWACARIEGMVRRFMPDDLDMLLTSLITLLITATLAYLIIMPLGGWLFEGMSWLFMHLNSNPFGCAVLAGLFLIAVVFGVHQGFIPVYLALMDSQGFNSLFPILSMAGAGQVGAALALYWRAQPHSALRSQVRGAIIPGLLGVGEPLIYGVTLPRMKPFVTACLGGAAGGLFIGLIAWWGLPMGLNSAFGPSGLVALPLMTSAQGILPAMAVYAGGILVAWVCGFIFTTLFGCRNVNLD